MIIHCPACSARYLVTEEQIGTPGRSVKCGKCAEVWFQEPLAEEPVIVVKHHYEPPPIAPPQHMASKGASDPRAGRRSRAVVTAGMVLMLVAIVLVSFMFARTLGLGGGLLQSFIGSSDTASEIPDLTVEVTDFVRHSEDDGFSLSVTGLITNPADQRQDVLDLQVRLLDADRRLIREETRPAPVDHLLPGAQASFSTIIRNIPANAQHLEVILPSSR